jgi:two-component system chemotaxis response regulator CheB
VVAASLGGPTALRELLGVIPESLPVPILIAQHLGTTSHLVEVLAPHSRLPVQWANLREHLARGRVYVAPPGRHLLVLRQGVAVAGRGPRVNYACPAADPLFISAARHYGRRALGVVLSGALYDGSDGAAAIRQAGGLVLVQDPESCVAPSMPLAARERTSTRLLLPPRSIGHAIATLTTVPGVDALLGSHAPDARSRLVSCPP